MDGTTVVVRRDERLDGWRFDGMDDSNRRFDGMDDSNRRFDGIDDVTASIVDYHRWSCAEYH